MKNKGNCFYYNFFLLKKNIYYKKNIDAEVLNWRARRPETIGFFWPKVSTNHNDAITDAYLNTRWHHGVYLCGCLERVARSDYGSCLDNVRGAVGAMNAELSQPDLLATVQSGRKQA